ncbi:Leucine Rich Repeat [Seminavis robusta]|uniref:Leucine Rich Repeat n=1 Tax=Seminavis robusta TaxID=568900 RepID=A0A9N8EBE0_9STRA|nr:Leucine Rich Repeat [Seminavis robusta]|eukprot:Sro921_g220400.1 Leucine Rich Repeat (733) ;mRNA; r:27056-29254
MQDSTHVSDNRCEQDNPNGDKRNDHGSSFGTHNSNDSSLIEDELGTSSDHQLLDVLVAKGQIPVIVERDGTTCTSNSGSHKQTNAKTLQGQKGPLSNETAPAALSQEINEHINSTGSRGDIPEDMPATTLHRNRLVQSVPGAFAAMPGQTSGQNQPLPRAQFSNLGIQTESAANTSNHTNHVGLSEAIPVSDDSDNDLQGARPVDTAAQDLRRKQGKKKMLGYFILSLFLLSIILAAVIPAFVAAKNDKVTQVPPAHFAVPTSSPSKAPTDAPTTAPTAIIEGLLPTTTILAIEQPLSPQNKAFIWLQEYPSLFNISDWRRLQLFALATFYYSFHGEEWPHILQDDWLVYHKLECDWYSDIFASLTFIMYATGDRQLIMRRRDTNESSCNERGAFTRLSLSIPSFSMVGSKHAPMPPEVALLTDLEEISMGSMGINGPLESGIIPALRQLTNLKTLSFNSCNFTGPLSTTFLQNLPIRTLEELAITASDDLYGTIPSELASLTSLRKLKIASLPRLSGTIPTELGSLSELKQLSLGNNDELNGTLPTHLYELTHLEDLHVSRTRLSGTISSLVAQLTSLTSLSASDTQLSGSIPTELGHLSKLRSLDLWYSGLTGNLPALNQLSQLTRLMLENNNLTGTITPTFISPKWPSSLTSLRLHDNRLSGSLPTNIWSLSSLRSLDLSNNYGLQGSISIAVDTFCGFILAVSEPQFFLWHHPFWQLSKYNFFAESRV